MLYSYSPTTCCIKILNSSSLDAALLLASQLVSCEIILGIAVFLSLDLSPHIVSW